MFDDDIGSESSGADSGYLKWWRGVAAVGGDIPEAGHFGELSGIHGDMIFHADGIGADAPAVNPNALRGSRLRGGRFLLWGRSRRLAIEACQGEIMCFF